MFFSSSNVLCVAGMNRIGVRRRRSSRITDNEDTELGGRPVDGMVHDDREADTAEVVRTEDVGTERREGGTGESTANSRAGQKDSLRQPFPAPYGRSMAWAWRCVPIIIVPMTIGALAKVLTRTKEIRGQGRIRLDPGLLSMNTRYTGYYSGRGNAYCGIYNRMKGGRFRGKRTMSEVVEDRAEMAMLGSGGENNDDERR